MNVSRFLVSLSIFLSMLFIFLAFPLLGFTQFETHDQMKAVLELVKQGDKVDITAKAVNDDNVIHSELSYLLISLKQNASGNLSNSQQEGEFMIKLDEIKVLSSMSVNLSTGDEFKVYLFIRDERDNLLLSKDSLIFSVNEDMSLAMQSKPAAVQKKGADPKLDNFMIKGLVIDETKTKVGADFFDLFYSAYSQVSDSYAFTLKLVEQASALRGSLLHIEAGNDTIFSTHLMPNEEYLKEQVEYALRTINYYNREQAQLARILEGI